MSVVLLQATQMLILVIPSASWRSCEDYYQETVAKHMVNVGCYGDATKQK